MNDDNTELMSRLLSSFKIEALDHLTSLSDGLLLLEKKPSLSEATETIQKMFRAAHSLKGAAKIVNFPEVEEICQSLEDVLSQLREGKISISKELINAFFECIDTVNSLLNNKNQEPQNVSTESTNALIFRLEEFLKPTTQSKKEPEYKDKPEPAFEAEARAHGEKIEENPNHPPLTIKTDPTHSIRIPKKKIDRLLQHVEEMLLIKLSSQQQIKELKKLHNLLSISNKEMMDQVSEKQIQLSKECLEALNSLIKLSEKDHRIISGMVDGVIDDTKDILMQPFSSLVDLLPRMARDLALSINKEVILDTFGSEIEIDRRILEQLKDPLIHALRNSIDHGIEIPKDRIKVGKPRQGQIKIIAKQISGSTFQVTITDDGRGIDLFNVKQKALQNGFISEKQKIHMSDDEAFMLLFQPGFTTNSIVTDLSGRGVGLNVLLENVERLGGTVEVSSNISQGTSITITMPMTLSTFRGIHVSVCNQDYILPTTHVQSVQRVPSGAVKTVENKEVIKLGDKTYSYVHLGRLLGIISPEKEGQSSQRLIVLIKASKICIALGVDTIHSEQEVFLKSLGRQLQRVKCLSAATIMEWGKIVPTLDPFDLVKTATQGFSTNATFNIPEDQSKSETKSILVVDDSITSRILLKNILEKEGYQVRSAVDGVEGLNILKHETVDLLVSDVEMPRMNGFELTKITRKTAATAELPIILCTSRGSKEDREHGIAVGANAYLDKSNFKQTGLIEIIAQLI